jgi:hypothetical protein
MSRPLFDIAREIATDWKTPSHQARTYLKAMYYLLGMDDWVADLDASTAVRMFLLYSREWTGPTAERIKAELVKMRSSVSPTNADLLAAGNFTPLAMSLSSCEMCDASLGTPAKCVDAYTHWGKRAHMCQHCALCLSPGLDVGDGALLIAGEAGAWLLLHGEPNATPPGARVAVHDENPTLPMNTLQPKFRHRLKLLGRRVIRKCTSVVRGMFRRSA